MVGIIPEERCDMEANVIGWHLLVSMIRLLSSHPSLTLFSPYWLQPCAQRYTAIARYPASRTAGSLQLCLFFLVDCFFVALHSDFLWHWLHSVWFLFSCCKIKLFQFQLLISIRSKVNYDFIFKLCKIPECDFGIWHLKKQIENIGLSRLNWLHFLGIFWMVHNKATKRPLCMWMSHFLIQPWTAQAKCKCYLLPWANGKCFVLKWISNESLCPYP